MNIKRKKSCEAAAKWKDYERTGASAAWKRVTRVSTRAPVTVSRGVSFHSRLKSNFMGAPGAGVQGRVKRAPARTIKTFRRNNLDEREMPTTTGTATRLFR